LPVFVVLVLNFRPQSQPKSPVRAQPANAPPPAQAANPPPPAQAANPPPQQAISKSPQAWEKLPAVPTLAAPKLSLLPPERQVITADAASILRETSKSNSIDPFASDEALKWLGYAATRNDPETQVRIGMCYADGDGVVKNLDTAAILFRSAAAQGNPHAQFNLGVMYAKGEGVVQNLTEAHKWYLGAALNGHIDVQFVVAGMYRDGFGVAKDHAEAYAWYTIAATAGDKEAADNVRNFEGAAPPAEMKRASRRAAKLLEQYLGH
jgi:TPR repeat protein